MTFGYRALQIGAVSLLAGCASTYTAPQGVQTVSVEYKNTGSTPLLYFDVFEDPKICGKRRPVMPSEGKYAFKYPANADLSFRIMYSQVRSPAVKMCDMYVTFSAESGYDFQIQSTDSEKACYVRVTKTDASGISTEVDVRMRQSSANMLGDMATSWCEPESR
jgi:hypothetical protein